MKKKKSKSKNDIVLILVIVLIALIGLATYVVSIKGNKSVEAYIMESKSKIKEEETIIVELDELPTEAIIEEEPEEEMEEQEKNNAKTNNTNTGTNAYYVKINYLANVVTVYGKDAEGNYTVPVKAMVCSTGTYTPKSGKYKTTGYKRTWNGLQGNVYGQYATQIVGNILFHSVPYIAKDPSALEYWEYDKLGTSASLGCVRLTVADAKWVYNNISKGTVIEFYSDSNPGPLGKPSAQKISSNADCRGWDPTDSAEGNPWQNVKQEEKVENKEDSKQDDKNENVIANEIEQTEKTNEEKSNTETANEVTNTEKNNTEKSSTEKSNTEKSSTEKSNTEKSNTEKDSIKKTNTEQTSEYKTNTQNSTVDKNNSEKTNREKTNKEQI